MAKKKIKPSQQKLMAWIDARRRHRLSHAQVQMARELGMNPKRLGKKDNHDQEPWKILLRHYSEYLYLKHYGKERPDVVLPWRRRSAATRRRRLANGKQSGCAARPRLLNKQSPRRVSREHA